MLHHENTMRSLKTRTTPVFDVEHLDMNAITFVKPMLMRGNGFTSPNNLMQHRRAIYNHGFSVLAKLTDDSWCKTGLSSSFVSYYDITCPCYHCVTHGSRPSSGCECEKCSDRITGKAYRDALVGW